MPPTDTKLPLPTQQQDVSISSGSSDSSSSSNRFKKYVSLVILVMQTSTLALLLRYSRTSKLDASANEKRYVSSTAVACCEVLKVVTCLVIIWAQKGFSLRGLTAELNADIRQKPGDTLKLIVPAGLYTLQNNLLFLALSYLDAATYQITYQFKILTTAIFSVLMLGTKLTLLKWFSLFVLMIGVACVQIAKTNMITTVTETNNPLIGLMAILMASMLSGFAGIYFEKILKGSTTSIWMRNVQLGIFGIMFGLMTVYSYDFTVITEGGFFQGYNVAVLFVIILSAVGGLAIAAVIKYADNIVKGFATSVSIIISSILSYLLLDDIMPNILFLLGSSLVIISTFLYSSDNKCNIFSRNTT